MLILVFLFGQMVSSSNHNVEQYDRKLKKATDICRSSKRNLVEEKVASARLAEEYKFLKQELAQSEDNLAKTLGEKASFETEMEAQMKRLWESRSDWVRREWKRVTESLLAKFSNRFKNLLRYFDDVKRTHDIALWISQVKGTLECVMIMKEKKGVAVPSEELERLEKDLAD